MIGFHSFSELDISSQMAANPTRVHEFLYNISSVAKKKATRDFELLKKDLPQNITLSPDGKFFAYDLGTVRIIRNLPSSILLLSFLLIIIHFL